MSERMRLQDLDPPEYTQLSPEQVLEAGKPFLDHFGVSELPENTAEFTEALRQLDSRYQGDRTKVRYELEQDQTTWPADTKEVIMQTAEDFRMLKPQTPLEGPFDIVISLGGARQSNIDRMRYAAGCLYTRAGLETMRDGVMWQGSLVLGGSKRPLRPDETQNAANYAPGAQTEEDLVMATFGKVDTVQNELAREHNCYPKIMSYGIAITEKEKASTEDVVDEVLASRMEWFKADGRDVPSDYRVGAVTTQIYQVATALALARAAKKYGITQTFVAGNPSDPQIVAKRTPATYHSEILKTLRVAAQAKAEGIQNVGLKEYPIRPFGFDYYI